MKQILRCQFCAVVDREFDVFLRRATDDSLEEIVGSESAKNKTPERGPPFAFISGWWKKAT